MTFPWHSVAIYPPIGIARVGNSEKDDGWFYGPEIPGHFEEPQGGFKDADGAVKRQAARFRVYAFDKDGKVLQEVNKDSGYDLTWRVQLVNKKASWYVFMGRLQEGAFKPGYTTLRNPTVQPDKFPDERDRLIVDSGRQEIRGCNAKAVPLAGKFYGSKEEATDVYLGEARTDEQGRLIVLAGRGLSRSIENPDDPYPYIMTDFDSPNWIDDTSDGRIGVTITSHAHTDQTVDVPVKARVIGTTPKFASSIYAPTTLYDVMQEVYTKQKRTKLGSDYDVGDVDWYRDIWPLLQRPPLLSWVNGQANGGHGPNSQGNFFDEGWQKALSDNSVEYEPIRKIVLGRMRLPETNSKYDRARVGQAYPYFMPWLSGDGGRTTAGDPTTFASVTELQYDKLVKWSEGKFTKKPVTLYTNFKDVPLSEQPSSLTKAALQATIGAPLYPGIEMSWNAELEETYDLHTAFTINSNVKAGDLTKFLSLPWQSDFYMCRSYWWPSARPDAVVTEETYKIVSRSVAPSNIAKKLTDRVPWERGLHLNYTDQYGDQPLFANTDMAQNWHQLGFIVQRPSSGPEPIFVEVQRGEIRRDTKLAQAPEHPPLSKAPKRHGPLILPTPDTPENPITTIESLRTHLQTAMAVELSTIPLYLYGMYSIKLPAEYANDPRYYDPIIGAIRGVVAEEMLHLSLAGNVLRAVGGEPKLYDIDYIPSYPMVMPGRIPKLTLQLRKANKKNLQTFVDVETPEKANAQPQPDKYNTLGQFYDAIKQGLTYLNKQEKDLFHPDTAAYQFSPGMGYQAKARDSGGSVVVTDLDTSLLALNTIIIQGEGASDTRPFDDPDHLEKDHYDVFLDLMTGDETWSTYPVLVNPVTSDYWKVDKRIYQVSLTFDAAYCFLLRTIETLWYVDKNERRHNLVLGNMYGIMMGVLAPIARFLVTQPIGTNGQNAAPCFGYYPFKSGVSELKQVQDEMTATINAYLAATEETPDQVAVANYGAMLETLLPIQTTINSLIDLGSFEKLEVTPTKKVKLAGVEQRGAKGFATGS